MLHRHLARAVVIGVVAGLLVWLALTIAVGVRLNGTRSDGVVHIRPLGVTLATGTRSGENRTAGLDPAGFVLAALPIAGCVGVALASRVRAGQVAVGAH